MTTDPERLADHLHAGSFHNGLYHRTLYKGDPFADHARSHDVEQLGRGGALAYAKNHRHEDLTDAEQAARSRRGTAL